MPQEIIFTAPKTSVTRLLLPALLLLSVGGWLLWLGVARQIIGCVVSGTGGVLLSCAVIVFLLRRLRRRSYSLALRETGLYDDASDAALGLIAWNDITHLQPGNISRREFLTVFVREPDKYLDRLSPPRQKLARAYHRQTGSPVNIPVAYLGASTGEILHAIESFLNRPASRSGIPA